MNAGVEGRSAGALEVLLGGAGSPSNRWGVTDHNLPQEIGRHDQTIRFMKGCYSGQETAARIDSQGHENRLPVGLKVDGRRILEPSVEPYGERSCGGPDHIDGVAATVRGTACLRLRAASLQPDGGHMRPELQRLTSSTPGLLLVEIRFQIG